MAYGRVMKDSLSFDRAAAFYDKTRDLPEAVATQGIQAILDAAGPGGRMLDVGTGTGRISVPLLQRGAKLVGCDLSPKMMELLRGKFPAARLAQADASLLPFPAKSFDAVTTCHVMHLVGPWREALEEYRRVLKPGGVYINARTEYDRAGSTEERIRDYWERRVAAYGADSKRPGVQNERELHSGLRELGATLNVVEVIRYSRPYTVQSVLEDLANRTHSHTWMISEQVLQTTVEEARDWALGEFKDFGAVVEENAVFILDIARFGS